MGTALSADAVSSKVMNNTMEGLYRLGKDDKLVPGVAKEFKKSEDGKNIHLNYVKTRNGQTVSL